MYTNTQVHTCDDHLPTPYPSGHIQPTLRIHHGVATCTTRDAKRSADVCITTSHNSGNSHKHCNHGNFVVALIAGMTDVECTTEQHANGSSSVLISRTSKKLATANRTGNTLDYRDHKYCRHTGS